MASYFRYKQESGINCLIYLSARTLVFPKMSNFCFKIEHQCLFVLLLSWVCVANCQLTFSPPTNPTTSIESSVFTNSHCSGLCVWRRLIARCLFLQTKRSPNGLTSSLSDDLGPRLVIYYPLPHHLSLCSDAETRMHAWLQLPCTQLRA